MFDGTWYRRRSLLRTIGASLLGATAGCSGRDGGEPETRTTSVVDTQHASGADTQHTAGADTRHTSGTSLSTTTATPPTVTQTETTGRTPTPVTRELHVSAYYYPWYKSDGSWLDHVPATPELGEYDSETSRIVRQHVEWSETAGIDSWCINWARTDQRETWIEDHFLPTDGSRNLEFCMQPATLGRFRWQDGRVDFDDEHNRRVLRTDLELFERRYFGEPNYLRIDGRPVVYYFASSAFTGDVEGAYRAAIDGLDEDPYLVADNVAKVPIPLYEARLDPFDAISPYNPYDSGLVRNEDFDEYLERVARWYLQSSLAVEHSGHDFLPTVIPGYDDTHVRPEADHPILQRSPDRFRQFCRVAREYAGSSRNVVFLTSFNEWPEYTAVEPTTDYGTTYLEVTREELTEYSSTPDQASYVPLVFDFDQTIDLVDGPGGRPIALMLGSLTLLDRDDEPVVAYDVGVPSEEPLFAEGAYGTERNDSNDPTTWRWLGGPTGRAVLYCRVDAETVSRAKLDGKPVRSGRIEMDVSFDGARTDHVRLGDRRGSPNTYSLSLLP